MDAKTRAATSIEHAQDELDRALAELDQMPVFDPSAIGFVAHALSNYATVMSATTDTLLRVLRNHPDPEVSVWLSGMNHAADLMQHTIGRLLQVSAPCDFPLKPEYVNMPLLLERGCHYYGRVAGPKRVGMTVRSIGHVPPVWADRVALAVVVDNLLSHAVKMTIRGGMIRIELEQEPDSDQVACSILFGGAGLAIADRSESFRAAVPWPGPGSPEPPVELALAVAWEFADLMGGSLWYEIGSEGKNYRFVFRLPLKGEYAA